MKTTTLKICLPLWKYKTTFAMGVAGSTVAAVTAMTPLVAVTVVLPRLKKDKNDR